MTQRLHTDDVNQCLHNKSGGHKVSNVNLFDFLFFLVDYRVKFCDLLWTSSSKTQMVFLKIKCSGFIIFKFDLCSPVFCLSFANNRYSRPLSSCGVICLVIARVILPHEKFLQFDLLRQWYFSLIWNNYMWKLQTCCG